MSKKGERQIINNIHELKLEIDYNKLEETIVKAHQAAVAEETKLDELSSAIKQFMSIFFAIVAIVFVTTGIYGVHSIYVGTEIAPVVSVFASAASLIYGIATIYLAFQTRKIQDKSYLMSFFSAAISLLALLVAIVK